MPGPALPVPRKNTSSTIALEFQPDLDADEHHILEDERYADDGLFQERFLLQRLTFAHCEFPRPTIQGHKKRVDWCAFRGSCGLRMCRSARHGSCSLLITDCCCDHPLRARRGD